MTVANEDFVQNRDLKSKTKAVEAVKKMMAKNLYSYIQHWKAINEEYKEKLRTTVKDKIIKYYMSMIRKAFNHWKVKHNTDIVNHNQFIVDEMQSEQT